MFTDEELRTASTESAPLFEQVDALKRLLDETRPLDTATVQRLDKWFEIEYVYHSSAIEGNPLTLRETEVILERGVTVSGQPLKERLEVANLAGAYNFVRDLATGKAPFSKANILDLHRLVLKGIDDEEAGRFRTSAVKIAGAEHSPTDPLLVESEMEKLVEWLSLHHEAHVLAVAAAAQWRLTNIHPFRDGNGRVARLLSNFILWRAGYPTLILRKEERDAYYEALAAADDGDLRLFFDFIASAALRSARLYEKSIGEQKRAEALLGGAADVAAKAAAERAVAYFNVWQAEMDAVKAEFRAQVAYLQRKLHPRIDLEFEDFGSLNFEKFNAILEHRPTENLWFFRVRMTDVTGRSKAFVFWFNRATQTVQEFSRRRSMISLHISTRHDPAWRTLAGPEPGMPSLREVFADQGRLYRRSWVEPGAGKHTCEAADAATITSTFLTEALATL